MSSTITHDDRVEMAYNDVARNRILYSVDPSEMNRLAYHAAAIKYRDLTGDDHIEVKVFGL